MFKVTYTDGTIFEGGQDLFDSKWNDIDENKQIKSLEYQLEKIYFILENCERYNHLVERVQLLTQEGEQISKVIVLALLSGKVLKLVIDFKTKQITKQFVDFGKEYNDKPATGWKQGVSLVEKFPPKFKLFK